MGKHIASAMGTEMQFMPQPDKDVDERVNDVEGFKGSTAQGASNSELLAKDYSDINGSWLNFINSHDKRWEDYSLSKATDLINGASDKDVKTLNAIDLAQTYGYGTLADNGYFKAFASQLRGKRLSDMATAAYTDKYGDNPLPVDKEEARYTQFMEDFKSNLNTEDWGENDVAFDEGFRSNNAQNAIELATSAAQRDVADRKDTTAKELMSQLSQYAANGMLKDDMPTASKKVNQICAGFKLAGLDPSTRTQIFDRFSEDVLSRGVIRNLNDWYKFEKSVMVQTNMDGSQTSLYDLRDKLADSQAALNYKKAHDINSYFELSQAYKNAPTPDAYIAQARKLANSTSLADRDQAQYMMDMFPRIFGGSGGGRTGRGRAGVIKGRPLGASKDALSDAMQQAKGNLVHDNIMAYMNNGASETDEHGNFIGKVKLSNGKGVSDADYYNGFCQVRDEIEGNTDLSPQDKNRQIMRLYEYAGMSPIKNAVTSQLCNTAQQMASDDVKNNGIEPWLIRADEARRSDPISFKNAFGDKFDTIIQQIQNLEPSEEPDPAMRLAKGYEKYLDAHHVDKATYEQNEKQCMTDTKNMSIEDAVGLDGSENNLVDVTDPQIAGKFKDSAILYMNNGMDAYSAYQLAMEDIKSSYTYYHGGYFPDSYIHGAGTDDNEHNFGIACDLLAGDLGGWDSGLGMKYNPNTGETTFIKPDGTVVRYTEDQMMNEVRAVPYMEQKLAEKEAAKQANANQAFTYHQAENEGKGEGLDNNPVDTNESGYSSFNSLKNVSEDDNAGGGKYII